MALILVIDDEPGIRRLVKRALARAGHEVLEAPHGREAMALLQKQNVDLVITDILMPEMEGIETIREIRRAFPTVAIVAMSGGGSVKRNMIYLDAASKLGADGILTKPFRKPDLIAAVADVLHRLGPRDR